MMVQLIRKSSAELFQIIKSEVACLNNRRGNSIEVQTAVFSQMRQNVA